MLRINHISDHKLSEAMLPNANLGLEVGVFHATSGNQCMVGPGRKSKVPISDWSLNLARVDWLKSNSKLDHVLYRPDICVVAALRSSKTPEKSSKTFILAVNLQVPGRDHHSAREAYERKNEEKILNASRKK
ncbi:protein of unknown function-containing protein [Forsythia ovata]|uniref:Protein ENHANCED DISEASE RESISTANCE 2 C-terminal domain-containing protein n=1 Tax=Forsythia ovata TaxID=205694 RepID=A0ABD1WBK0_9LAMI